MIYVHSEEIWRAKRRISFGKSVRRGKQWVTSILVDGKEYAKMHSQGRFKMFTLVAAKGVKTLSPYSSVIDSIGRRTRAHIKVLIAMELLAEKYGTAVEYPGYWWKYHRIKERMREQDGRKEA